MSGACPDALAQAFFDPWKQLCIVKERDVLFPGNSYHDPEPVPMGDIEEPRWRYGVRPDRIDSVARHFRAVTLKRRGIVILASGFARPKWSVRYSLNVNLFTG